ncbi:mannosyltransferase putative-domain-containing protein [Mucor mucedo]|uniref:mannosyltransferase putative-domain-containing protein n=1 Tax=Mucor mucedo TaxID=29922 RepID=UPI002220DA81|nr:mannosyltransferase putative-domain-containing protein [Mucor mucedo]KAI7889777.1 mannosyltransferase putative-domain-containing protein [Mucor mucedo]
MGTIRLLQLTYLCTLPIEIWHMEHEADTAATFQEEISSFRDVRLRDLSDLGLIKSISRRRNLGKQFQVKAAAIINSRFQHVLFLDSDNIPTRDPSFLFATPEYKHKGAIFWPDFWKTASENKIFRLLEISSENVWEQESGQILIDKERHWIPLQLAWYMQYYHELYFKLLNGDKDTFQYAWRALDAPFHRIQTFLSMAGLLYMDGEDDTPLFIHANLMKQMPRHVFNQRPWHWIKRHRGDRSSVILPQFYMAMNNTLGCMDFPLQKDLDDFDQLLPHFQKAYFESGGIGGYNTYIES